MMIAFQYRSFIYALLACGLFTHSICSAQSGRIKIVEIVETAVKNVAVQIKDGDASRPAQIGVFVNASSMICTQIPAKTKVILFLQQENGGDARPVEVDGSKGCQAVDMLWERSSSLSIQSYFRSIANFFKREGGVTIRASASTQGSTRGDTPRTNSGRYCPLYDFKPLSASRFVYLPEGAHALTFAAQVTKPLNVELVDDKGLVLLKAQVAKQRLDLPLFSFQSNRQYTLRSADQHDCKIDVSVEKHENLNYSFDRALEMTPDSDTAKAIYADLVLNEPLLELWHPYALSLIRPTADGVSSAKSNAAWGVFWPHFQKLAAEAKQ